MRQLNLQHLEIKMLQQREEKKGFQRETIHNIYKTGLYPTVWYHIPKPKVHKNKNVKTSEVGCRG